jgi:hypothetical protein
MTETDNLRLPTGSHKRYLDGLKKATAHKELAVAAALHFCAEERLIPPKWVLEGSVELLCDLLKREKAQTRGRAAGKLARYRQSMWDVERWNAVDQVRQIRAQNASDAALIKAHPDSYADSQKAHNQKMRLWLRHGTFACASMYLHGSYARIGVEAMKASHRRVRHAFGDPSNTDYWYIDPRFLWQVGIDDRIETPGTKWVHLYNLTP